MSVDRTAGGFTVSVAAPQGRYNPGPRKFGFVIKSERRTLAAVTITDDGSARKLKIQ